MMAGEEIGTAAARGDGLLARLQGHPAHPGADCANAVNDRAFKEGVKRRAQRLEEIVKEKTGDVVGDHKHGPCNHGGGKHSDWPVEEAANRNQHGHQEQSVGGGVALEGAIIEPGQAIRGHERSSHHDDEQGSGVQAGA